MNIKESHEIYMDAINKFNPKATVIMLSGGDDSITVLHLALELGIDIDLIIHANTGTGLPEATQYVRSVATKTNIPYVETKAGSAYENYVLRKGFFGVGATAHSYAYHVLKASGFRTAISRNLRKRKRDFPVLCLNGVRIEESENRADNYADQTYRRDPASPNNIWLNLIHYWTKEECLDFLGSKNVRRSPVACALGRSGECMCGTMQNQATRIQASDFSPEWGKWIDELEKKVLQKFPWGWGKQVPKSWTLEKHGQGNLFNGFTPEFQPACVGCKSKTRQKINQPN